ncbi:MAG: hypothetical protein ACFE8J_11300 [Candidatus Heimdallarchaeota archaeon]
MESLQTINNLQIPTNNLFYDKKSEVLSIYIFDFVFIGTYKGSIKIRKILDDLYRSLGEVQLRRENVKIVDFITSSPISENTKLKQLKLISAKEKEKRKLEKVLKKPVVREITPLEEEKVATKQVKASPKKKKAADNRRKAKEEAYDKEEVLYEEEAEELLSMDDESFGEAEKFRSYEPEPPPPAGGVAPPPKAAPPVPSAPTRDALTGPGAPPKKDFAELERIEEVEPSKPKPTVYEINMGLQYYSVMMEQNSYLFYVYFSHKELKIVDEEGKTIFETSFRIETIKKEPPILDLKVEGEGFEVHPLYGKVEVKKDAINPPVMIFSILPTKKKKRTKKEKKEGERRYLHVYIDFEGKTINHSILSIIVQPKHFHLDIGPIHLDISKRAAMIISFISVLVAVGSLIFTFLTIDPGSTFVDFISNFAPGLGSILFIVIFLVTLFKEGIYPLKEKISYFLNFDKTGMLIK